MEVPWASAVREGWLPRVGWCSVTTLARKCSVDLGNKLGYVDYCSFFLGGGWILGIEMFLLPK